MKVEKKELLKLRDKHKGGRCFIVGNGPSLNQLDLSKLKDEVTIVCNLIFRQGLPFQPMYYCQEDKKMLRFFHKEIMAWHVPGMVKFFPAEMKKFVKGKDARLVNFVYGNPTWRFSTAWPREVNWGSSVSYMMLQLAWYLGCEYVYLIGMDLGGGHFVSEKDYYKGKSGNPSKWDQVIHGYQVAHRVYRDTLRHLINATPGGNLSVLPRVKYGGLFS